MTLRINYSNIESDLIAFTQHHLDNNNDYQKRKRINLYVTPIALLLIFLVIGFVENKVSFYVGGAIGASATFFWYFFAYKNHASKCAQLSQKEVLCNHQLVINDDGIIESTENSENRLNWTAIERVETNGSFIFIYNTPATAIVVPKRELEESGFSEVVGILEEKIEVIHR